MNKIVVGIAVLVLVVSGVVVGYVPTYAQTSVYLPLASYAPNVPSCPYVSLTKEVVYQYPHEGQILAHTWVRGEAKINPDAVHGGGSSFTVTSGHPDTNWYIDEYTMSPTGATVHNVLKKGIDGPVEWDWRFNLEVTEPPERLVAGEEYELSLSATTTLSSNHYIAAYVGYAVDGVDAVDIVPLFDGQKGDVDADDNVSVGAGRGGAGYVEKSEQTYVITVKENAPDEFKIVSYIGARWPIAEWTYQKQQEYLTGAILYDKGNPALAPGARNADQDHLENLTNLRYDQYTQIAQRLDFYLWFYEYTFAQGYHTRWPLAAWLVADGANEIATIDWTEGGATLTYYMNNEVQALARTGNQVIFDDVFPKLKELLEGGPLTGTAAREWDAQVLSEEQELVQSMYNHTSASTLTMFEGIAKKQGLIFLYTYFTSVDEREEGPGRKAGTIPPFEGDILNGDDRWRFGMRLGETFCALPPYGTEPTRPEPGEAYTSGERFKEVNVRPGLHKLDARLNDTDVPKEEVVKIIQTLTDREQAEFMKDAWRVERLAKALAFDEMKDAIGDLKKLTLETKLELLESSLRISWRFVSYDEIKAMVQAATQAERDALKTDRWMEVFVAICTNQTILEALADLNFDEDTKNRWIEAEG